MEIENFERFDDVDAVAVAEFFVCRRTYHGIHMDRIDRAHIGMLVDDPADRAEHMVHRFAEIFTAVRGDEDQTGTFCPFEFGMGVVSADGGFECIDRGVAGHVNGGRIAAFLQEIVLRQFRRSKIEAGDDADRLTVEFFRVGGVDIVRTQSGFDMTDGNLHIEAGKCGHKGRGSIAVNENDVRLHFGKNFADPFENIDRHVEEGLFVLHDGKVIVGGNIERMENLIEHLTVLTGHAEGHIQFGTLLEFQNQRTHFNRFRTGTENEHNFFHKIYLF